MCVFCECVLQNDECYCTHATEDKLLILSLWHQSRLLHNHASSMCVQLIQSNQKFRRKIWPNHVRCTAAFESRPDLTALTEPLTLTARHHHHLLVCACHQNCHLQLQTVYDVCQVHLQLHPAF